MIEDGQNWEETVISRVGRAGKYQLLLFINFSFKWMLAGMVLFCLNFIYITPEFKCSKDEMKSGKTCSQFVCSIEDEQFWYSHMERPIPSSIALDYGIIMACSKAWISSLLQSLSYLGSFTGYIVMSHIADNYGRKKTEMVSWIINIVGLTILVCSGKNLYLVGVGGFLMGLGTNATITLHYTFLKELIVGHMRERSIIALQIMFSLGVSFVALLSMLIYSWKVIVACFMLVPSLILIPFSLWIIEQTPNFSLKKGKNQLLKSLNKIARINGTEEMAMQDLDFIPEKKEKPGAQNEYSLIDLFRYRSLCKISIICALVDLIIEFVYDGTILSLDKIGINVYLDQILVGLVEIFAAIFCSWIIVRAERKKFTIIAMALAAIFIFIIGILALFFEHKNNEINAHTIGEMILLALLRFVLNSVWGVFFVYIAELFPSNITSLSFGWVSAIGTVGAFSAPYIRLLTANATMFIMSGLCVFSIFLVSQLNETKGKRIRQEILERQQEGKRSVVSSDGQI